MRLAIIMSGMLRNFDHTYFATKKFLLKDEFFNQKDIFFCGYADTFDLDTSINKFNNLYKPKKFQIEKWDEKIKKSIESKSKSNKWPRYHTASSVTNIMSAWRCRYIANQFKTEIEKLHNFKYDLVYQLRTDLFCFDYIEHKLAIKAAQEKSSVYVPPDWDFKNVDPIAVGDMVAYGSSDAMNEYFSLYLHAEKYWLKGIKGHPETILGNHFRDRKIKREFCNRNVVREYPYSVPEFDFIWSKWPIEEVKNNLSIDEEFLLKKRISLKKTNKFLRIISKFKKLINIKNIVRSLKEFKKN